MEALFVQQPQGKAANGLEPVRLGRRRLRVLLAGRIASEGSPHHPELQMAAAAQTLPGLGIAARLWRPWEDPLGDFDCLHLFGSAPEHLSMLDAARQARLPVALSPMLWYDAPPRAYQRPALGRRVAALAEQVRRSVCPGWHSWRHDLYESADLLLPNSNAEAQQIMREFQVPAERIQIVPHAADPGQAAVAPGPFVELYGLRDFVLLAGAIDPRNHQLNFLWAVREMEVPVVVLGDVTPGCDWYLDECRRAAGERVRFIPQLDHDDQLRGSAYAAARCIVLGGGFETSAQQALEAGMSGMAIVLSEDGYGREYFGQQAIYVQTDDLPGMRRAVRMALGRGRSKQLAEHVAAYFSWNAAGRILRQAYDGLLRSRNEKTPAREPGNWL